MTQLYPEIDITNDQAEAIARGLFAVARADGNVHPAEAAIIGQFFGAAAQPSHIESLARETNIDAASLALLLPSKELREVFLRTAVLLAYADGNFADGEKEQIASFATAMNMESNELEQIILAVKEFLLSQLSHLQNVDAGVEIAKELDI